MRTHYYMDKTITLVRINLRHENCWTSEPSVPNCKEETKIDFSFFAKRLIQRFYQIYVKKVFKVYLRFGTQCIPQNRF